MFRLVAVFVISVLVCGTVGLFMGMTVGGNYGGGSCVNIKGEMVCDESEKGFTYMGQVGWEGGGLLGLHAGILIGLGLGTYIWKTRFNKQS